VIKRLLNIYYYKVWNKKEFRLLPFLFADRCKVNYINKPCGSSIIWRVGDIKENIEDWHHAIPDIKVSIINLICDKQYVTAHYALQGTCSKEYRNNGPAGKCFTVEILEMFKIEGGKISEHWVAADRNEILERITTPVKSFLADQSL
jgi:predicted ester cyclase